MLFNSYAFIFVFLPVALVLFYASKHLYGHKAAQIALLACSLFFYGWWNPNYLLLILSSAVFNFYMGSLLARSPKRTLYLFAISANILLLGYYKYLNFFIENMNTLTGSQYIIEQILLPLAISFFTFQQISYLSGCYHKKRNEDGFTQYLLFICFFPQLIAGPIVHHKEILKQFTANSFAVINPHLLIIGFCIFTIGLAKKLLLADNLALYVDPVFSTAGDGGNFSNTDAWMALLAYKFQLYFDFSGYADMAIGLGLMFGIHLPINFESPYKARNLFEFWNRWHTTLARFMRTHIYRPLARRFKFYMGAQLALILNILIGGIWHGADWNFLLWGLFNGFLLVANHFYRKASHPMIKPALQNNMLYIGLCIAVTFFATMLSSVLFRSENITAINGMFTHLFVLNQHAPLLETNWLDYVFIIGLFFVVWCLPNTKQLFEAHKVGISLVKSIPNSLITWRIDRIGIKYSLLFSLVFFMCIMMLSNEKAFIYFQF